MILQVLASILGIIMLVVFFWYISISKRELKEPDTTPILINHMKKHSDGHAFLKVEEMKIGEKRIKIIGYPRDFNRKKLVKMNKGKIKKEAIILYFDKNFVDFKNDLSDYVPVIEAYPDKIEHLCDSDKKDSKIIERINNGLKIRDIENIYEERQKAQEKIGLKLARGELFTEYQKQINDLKADSMLLMNKKDENKK